jgi:hypothetical protein
MKSPLTDAQRARLLCLITEFESDDMYLSAAEMQECLTLLILEYKDVAKALKVIIEGSPKPRIGDWE